MRDKADDQCVICTKIDDDVQNSLDICGHPNRVTRCRVHCSKIISNFLAISYKPIYRATGNETSTREEIHKLFQK